MSSDDKKLNEIRAAIIVSHFDGPTFFNYWTEEHAATALAFSLPIQLMLEVLKPLSMLEKQTIGFPFSTKKMKIMVCNKRCSYWLVPYLDRAD